MELEPNVHVPFRIGTSTAKKDEVQKDLVVMLAPRKVVGA
jgi:hypothetical protein